jgi:hypothetical protein
MLEALLKDLLSFSNIISILALLFSFYSIIYSKRQYEATFFPRISIQVLERSCGKSGLKTCLSFKLRNHSSDRSATDLKLQASLSHPVWQWRLWTIKWFQFFEREHLDVPPNETKEIRPLSQGQNAQELENFLLESFPRIVYPENDPNTPEEVAFRRPISFLLRVRVVYQPPILRANDIKQDFYYKLIPHFRHNNGNLYCLNFWEIKFLKAR